MKARFLVRAVPLFAAASSAAAVFTNAASVDAFVRASVVNSNYGGAVALSVSGPLATNASGFTNGAFDTFIRFNTGTMVANFNSLYGTSNWVIRSANLRVTEIGAPTNSIFNRGAGSFQVRWIANDNWTEGTGLPNAPTTNGIVYNNETNLLNAGTDAALGSFTNAGVDGTLVFPLGLPVAFVNDLRAGGEVGLFLKANSPGLGFTFNSRTAATNSAQPFLEITAAPPTGISFLSFSGPDVVLHCTNGAAGGMYFTLTSTNAGAPLNQWQSVATNILFIGGSFIITVPNAFNPSPPARQFFILQMQ